jgi:hypothetical protein
MTFSASTSAPALVITGRGGAVAGRALGQAGLRDAVVALAHGHDGHQAGIAQHVHARIAQLQRAAVAFGIHGGQLFLHHLLHAHAAGVEGEAVLGRSVEWACSMAGTSVSMVVLELGTIWPMRNVWVMTCLCRVLRVSDQNQLSVYALFLQKICRLANDVLLGVCTYLVRNCTKNVEFQFILPPMVHA